MADYYIGLDLGQAQDHTALAVLERVEVPGERSIDAEPEKETHYYVRHLERFRLGTPYPAVVERVRELLATEPLAGQTRVVVDATGVGAPVVDLLRQACEAVNAITITGGEAVVRDGSDYRVPKRDLVTTVQVLLQTERLRIASALPLADTLMKELLDFRVKITLQGHDTYGVWREGAHDNLVLAVALACWFGEQYQPVCFF